MGGLTFSEQGCRSWWGLEDKWEAVTLGEDGGEAVVDM